MRARHIAPMVLVLAATVVGVAAARALGNRDVDSESIHRAEIAATEIRGRLEQEAALVDSIRRFLTRTSPGDVTNEQFANLEAQGLGATGLPAAAWVERVSGSERAAYERRVGPIVATSTSAPVGPRALYLPATLATGVAPMTRPGIDLGLESGIAAAIARPRTLYRVTATPLVTLRNGATGLFLVQSAQRLSGGVVEPGFVVLFVPDSWLLAPATASFHRASRLQLTIGGHSAGGLRGARPARTAFTGFGQPFEVFVPRVSVHGSARLLPWLIGAAGLVFAVLGGALGVNRARRARAQRELDRIFNVSPDLIAVAGFDGYFRRVNPAVAPILGYTEEEFLARPFIDLVHPDDRERTESEMSAITQGKTAISFENRYVAKDGSYKWLEWTSAPDVDERLTYGVARDVTQRRAAEEEQTALRRVATLVAEGGSPQKLLAVVAKEVAFVAHVPIVSIVRYESDDTATELASFSEGGEVFQVGTHWALDGTSVVVQVRDTGRPARIDDHSGLEGHIAESVRRVGIRSSVGTPIAVAGRLWGAIVVSSAEVDALPEDTEARLAGFTELVATAIANAESRKALAELAQQQAALRRVATLVAEGVAPEEVFSALGEEVNGLFGAENSAIARLEADGDVTIVGNSGIATEALALGARLKPQPDGALTAVIRTGVSARRDDYDGATRGLPGGIRSLGFRSTLAAPIVVEGALWGVIVVGTREHFPDATEQRLEEFTELAATAIANAEGRAELTASRARIVAASDETRRRIERDLHDGAQQQLVALALELRAAEQRVPDEIAELKTELSRVAEGLAGAVGNLREMSRGIHPAILAEGGLGPALRTLARRSPVPVEVDVRVDSRLPEPVEVAAYYVVSEGLANAAKHAHASVVGIDAERRDGVLHVSIRDDGRGGADPAKGSGLIGLRDRVEALGGSIDVTSRPGAGTHIVVELPVP